MLERAKTRFRKRIVEYYVGSLEKRCNFGFRIFLFACVDGDGGGG